MAQYGYRKLLAWQKAIQLVQDVYELAAELPSDERFGLRTQLQRAAVSIPANVAEGYGRVHRKEYVHHLSFARGSLYEVETLITLVARLKLVSRTRLLELWKATQQVGQVLNRLIASLQGPGPGTRDPEPVPEHSD